MSEIRKGRFTGEQSWNWINDRTSVLEKHRLRGTESWRIWRETVFERDNYTCQECGQQGGHLEPHHITPLRDLTDELFEPKNGITLCRPCHQKTVWKESDYAEKYTAIVAARS